VVSLLAQVAAVHALQDPVYYAARYAETAALRAELATALGSLGWAVVPGVANFLFCHLPGHGPTAAELAMRSRSHGLFLRDASTMGSQLGPHAIRIAVKDAATNTRMLEILGTVTGMA